jgi:hypothetical protein
MTINSNVRNAVIVLAIAAVVAFVPGAANGTGILTQAISMAFLAALAWVGAVTYRQNRSTLYSLGDGRRAALYGALAVLAVTLTATPRLWVSAGGSVAWLVLVGASAYVGGAVIWSARKYQ